MKATSYNILRIRLQIATDRIKSKKRSQPSKSQAGSRCSRKSAKIRSDAKQKRGKLGRQGLPFCLRRRMS